MFVTSQTVKNPLRTGDRQMSEKQEQQIMNTPGKNNSEKQTRQALKKELDRREPWPTGTTDKKNSEEMGFELGEAQSVGQSAPRAEPPYTGRTDSTTNTQ